MKLLINGNPCLLKIMPLGVMVLSALQQHWNQTWFSHHSFSVVSVFFFACYSNICLFQYFFIVNSSAAFFILPLSCFSFLWCYLMKLIDMLKSVVVADNGIGCDGIACFAEALKSNRNLKRLNVYSKFCLFLVNVNWLVTQIFGLWIFNSVFLD